MGQLFSQIPTVTQILTDREQQCRIEIKWSSADEMQWHDDNDGRLEIMGLKTEISSSAISNLAYETFSFSMQGDRPCRVELFFELEYVAPGENVFLRNTISGENVLDIGQTGKTRLLTSAFDPAVMELVWQNKNGAIRQSRFSIPTIYFDNDTQRGSLGIGFNMAMACHPNAACKTDSISRLISNSAVRMRLVMDEGIGWCTGALINNTRQDRTPYLLTAYHCRFNYTPKWDMWRFDFDYRSAECENPAVEPAFFSLTGCELIASGQESDFLLIRLDDKIPSNEQVTFAGWDHADEIPQACHLVHHPSADIRKFSSCTTSIVIHPNAINWSEGYNTPADHHFRFKFNIGGHEPGSSGGPVFNQDGLMVAQLHGGTSGCEIQNTTFTGRLSRSWELGSTPQARLRDWLDPDQTGVEQLASIENISAGNSIDIVGIVKDPMDRPVKNTIIEVTGSVEMELTTDSLGRFSLNAVDRSGEYILTPKKDTRPANGLNVLDLIAVQKHLLGKDTFDFQWQHIAADATFNGSVSVGDALLILKMLLGKISFFPSTPSWRFDPHEIRLESLPPGPQPDILFTAIKIGDVNATADPSL